MATGIEGTEGTVDRHQIPELGVVHTHRHHAVALPEHILGETLQGAFGSHLHEHPRTGGVQRIEALHELHRGGHLLPEDVEHLVTGGWIHRVELTRDVGHDRRGGWREAQAREHFAERLARLRDDLGVERMADGQLDDVEAGVGEHLRSLVHPLAGTTDHGLPRAVEVGEHGVAPDGRERALDVLDGSEDGGHLAVVRHAHLGHFAPSGAHGFQRVLER